MGAGMGMQLGRVADARVEVLSGDRRRRGVEEARPVRSWFCWPCVGEQGEFQTSHVVIVALLMRETPRWFGEAAMLSFLDLPFDLRLIVYDLVLADHHIVLQSKQPSNAHFAFLYTCRQVYYEAADTFRTYVSLRNEFQMERFHHYISSSPETALSVRWADVANDGRIVESLRTGRVCVPLASLPQSLIRPT